MRNGTKKLRSNAVEVNTEVPVRISSKRFTDDVVPLLLKQQREDHYDVFVTSNRRKCELKPLIFEDVLNFVKLKNGGKGTEEHRWTWRKPATASAWKPRRKSSKKVCQKIISTSPKFH